MSVKQIIGLLILLLSLSRVTTGQSLSGDFPVHHGVYSFGNSREDNVSARSGNAIVKQLALQLLKAPEKTRYNVTFSYRLLAASVKDGILIFSFRLNIDSVTGDVKAGVFDVSGVLKPRSVSFQLDLTGDGGQLLDTINISRLVPGQDTLFMRSYKANPVYYSGLKDVRVKSIKFGYSESQQTSILNRLNNIKTYNAVCVLSDSIQKVADRLNRKALVPSPELAFEIFHLSGAVHVFGRMNRQLKAAPGSSDPAHLKQKQVRMSYLVSLIQKNFLKQIMSAGLKQPSKNIQGLAQWWVAGQVNLLTEKRYPGFIAPVFYKLGKLSFSPPDLAFLRTALKLMISASGSERSMQGYAWAFCDAAGKNYLKQGAHLSSEGRFTEAADLLGNAYGMCSSVPYITCSDRLFQQQARAYYGTYYSYLGVARKALAGNLPEIASDYVASAAAFQKVNSRFIIVNSEVENLSSQLAYIWLNRGNKALESGKLTVALHYFVKAESATASANHGIASGAISGKVRDIRRQIAGYKVDGRGEITNPHQSSTDEDEESVRLSDARAILNTDDTSANVQYENLKFRMIITEIENNLEKSKKSLKKGDCEGAIRFLNNSKQLLNDFQLPETGLLEEEFSAISHIVDSCFCLRKKQASLKFYKDAKRLADTRDFIAAYSLCAKAIKLVEGEGACNGDRNNLVSLQGSLKWPADYQRLLLKVDSLANAGLAFGAVEFFHLAGEIFVQHELNKSGLRHMSLVDYAIGKHNKEIYTHSIILLLRQDNLEESLLLLGRMKSDRFTAADCREAQEMVALKLATRDGPESNPLLIQQKLIEYTGGSEWFIYFKKMYLRVNR